MKHIKKKQRKSIFNKGLLVVIASFSSLVMLAHGDLSKRIAAKTHQIEKEPKNFTLYYERGLLYQEHKEYPEALQDYKKSKTLGNTNEVVNYRLAQVHFSIEKYDAALSDITAYLKRNSTDVKGKKVEAQILFKKKAYSKALNSYQYVFENTTDLRPEDVIEYTEITLAQNHDNYKDALTIIEKGLVKIGTKTTALQLKKLEYLVASKQENKAIEQYNYFIKEIERKEFWYYRKAKYLAEINRKEEAIINLKLATVTVDQLGTKFQNRSSVITLKEQIKQLDNSINN
ncbi:tetratricopeptide repeat protein [Flavobacterium sp. SM2513]|uniref:tetratricopeptide repeat protein n=1 Tax=Flavobacterium sp. SM2513 TaxID=3424766 RepID=UPI003D7FB8CB